MSRTDRLNSLLALAAERARTNRRRVLVSMVERVLPEYPLNALERAALAAVADCATAKLIATRMYWTRPDDDFALAGLGAAVTLTPEGADRFATIDREWSTLIDDALIDDPSGGTPGAGPALMGGFAFDPEGPRTALWRDFPAAHLIVPRLQIVLTGPDCWLTTTVLVRADGQQDVDPTVLARLRDEILGSDHGDAEPTASVNADDTITCTDTRDASDWRETVRDAVTAISAGRLEKVVLARGVRASAAHDFDVMTALRQLRSEHPSCYVFGFWHGDSAFVGATPERLVRVDGRNVRASSLAGSAPRGETQQEDTELAGQLLASTKNRTEHEIVRQALRTGLERLCDDVTAAEEPALLSLPHVHHLHTAVHARLRAGHSLLQLVAQLHPTPAVGGAPRNAALRFIREHEKMDRGWYAAPIGWLQRDCGEFAVALRSALVIGADAVLFAGCGIVADSDPDQEYAESLLKLRPMETALAVALAPEEAIGNVMSDNDLPTAYSGGAR